MDCSEVYLYVLSLLDREEEDPPPELKEHLDRCPSCRETYQSVRAADEAMTRAVPLLAPEQTYLTEQRLTALLEATQPARPPGNKVVNMMPARLRHIAIAATLLVVMGGLFLLLSHPATETETPEGRAGATTGEATATAMQEGTFRIINDFDRSITATADLSKIPGFEPYTLPDDPDALLTIAPEGLSTPVRETTRLRRDDYWW